MIVDSIVMLTLGELLRKKRVQLGMSFDQVEKTIKIRTKYLQALEKNNWAIFPSKTYIIGAINNYSKVLGLEKNKMTAFFRRDYEKKEKLAFREKVSSRYLTSETKKWAFVLLAFVFLTFFVYFGIQLSIFLSPPKLVILTPQKDRFIKGSVLVKGKVGKEATVTVFDEPVVTNKKGEFEYNFPLKKGKNLLIIKVVGANGKEKVFRKTFIKEG